MLHGNVSRKGYGNALQIGMVAVLRKDIRRFMMTERIVPRVWMHRRSLHQLPREGQCTVPKRLAKYGKVEVPTIEYSNQFGELMHLLSVTLYLIRRFTKRQVPEEECMGDVRDDDNCFLPFVGYPKWKVRCRISANFPYVEDRVCLLQDSGNDKQVSTVQLTRTCTQHK